jgi:hypothetical protein
MIWESLKDELASPGEDKENSRTNIQMNLKKLEAISKGTERLGTVVMDRLDRTDLGRPY